METKESRSSLGHGYGRGFASFLEAKYGTKLYLISLTPLQNLIPFWEKILIVLSTRSPKNLQFTHTTGANLKSLQKNVNLIEKRKTNLHIDNRATGRLLVTRSPNMPRNLCLP